MGIYVGDHFFGLMSGADTPLKFKTKEEVIKIAKEVHTNLSQAEFDSSRSWRIALAEVKNEEFDEME